MNEAKSAFRGPASYDADFSAWSSEQARRLRKLKPHGLDWQNLAEEVESLGRSDKRAIGSALKIILEHLIKWRFQPEKRSSSWSDSIEEHRDRIIRILEDSPSLATLPRSLLEQEYSRGRRKALRDTRLPSGNVPAACPFTVDEVLDPGFWPDSAQGDSPDTEAGREGD
jgi:hypothetical protein